MDLSFPGFDRRTEVDRLPGDLSAIVAGIATRHPVVEAPRFGRTLRPSRLLHPLDCAFNGAMAAMLMAWRGAPGPEGAEHEAAVYRGVSGDLQVRPARDSVAFREGAPRPDRG